MISIPLMSFWTSLPPWRCDTFPKRPAELLNCRSVDVSWMVENKSNFGTQNSKKVCYKNSKIYGRQFSQCSNKNTERPLNVLQLHMSPRGWTQQAALNRSQQLSWGKGNNELRSVSEKYCKESRPWCIMQGSMPSILKVWGPLNKTQRFLGPLRSSLEVIVSDSVTACKLMSFQHWMSVTVYLKIEQLPDSQCLIIFLWFRVQSKRI